MHQFQAFWRFISATIIIMRGCRSISAIIVIFRGRKNQKKNLAKKSNNNKKKHGKIVKLFHKSKFHFNLDCIYFDQNLTVLWLSLNFVRCASPKRALHADQLRPQHFWLCGIFSLVHHRWRGTAANSSSTFSLHMIHLHHGICNRCAISSLPAKRKHQQQQQHQQEIKYEQTDNDLEWSSDSAIQREGERARESEWEAEKTQ